MNTQENAILAAIKMVGGLLLSDEISPEQIGEIFGEISKDDEVLVKFQEFLTTYNEKFNERYREIVGKDDVKSMIVIFPYAVPETDEKYTENIRLYFESLADNIDQH